MPDNIHTAHARYVEELERIYIGRCFSTEAGRLESLFYMYTAMTTKVSA